MSKVVEAIHSALDTLGVPTLVSMKDIQSRYRYLATTHHPDAGGEGERMREINHAYEILKRYVENYKFDFSEEEIMRQFPGELHAKRFKV